MRRIEQSIEVNVPVKTAYNQWTQFESFPQFMDGVKKVRQIDNNQLEWCAQVGGKEVAWTAEITEQIPDKKIAWTSTQGATNNGMVTFHSSSKGTKVMLSLEYDPEGFIENTGSATGVVESRVKGDLKRFKDFVESRGGETGEWRGKIQGGHEMKR